MSALTLIILQSLDYSSEQYVLLEIIFSTIILGNRFAGKSSPLYIYCKWSFRVSANGELRPVSKQSIFGQQQNLLDEESEKNLHFIILHKSQIWAP